MAESYTIYDWNDYFDYTVCLSVWLIIILVSFKIVAVTSW